MREIEKRNKEERGKKLKYSKELIGGIEIRNKRGGTEKEGKRQNREK
jgi:hypothetical protein